MPKHTVELGEIVLSKSFQKAGYLLYMTVHAFTDKSGKMDQSKLDEYVHCKYYYQPTGEFRKELFHVDELDKIK